MNGTTVDPAIVAAYQSIVCYETNWLLLHYDNDNFDDLVFYAHGYEGLEELKTKIYDLDKVFVAFYREENEHNPGYILINYIPAGISGVKRGKGPKPGFLRGCVAEHAPNLFVHSEGARAFTALSQLTSSTIHQALVDPGSFTPPPVGHSFSHTPETSLTNPPPFQSNSATRTTTKKPKPITLDMVRRSFSETYAPHIIPPKRSPPVPPVPPIPASVHKTSGMFVNLLRRMKESDDTPPPTPPKDDIPHYRSRPSPPRRSTTSPNHELPPIPNYSREHSPTGSLTEFGFVSRYSSENDTVVIQPPPKDAHRLRVKVSTVPLKGKWAREPIPANPEERERRRQERKKQRELEERQALEEEKRRQEEIKRRKEEQLRQEEEEERQRRQRLTEELRRISEEKERRRREELEREERKKREMEERRRIEREKRLEEHRRAEQWRREQDRLREEEARRAALEKKREEEERLRKIQQAEKAIAQTHEESLRTGWITIQFPESLFWKRRYFKCTDKTLSLYRNPKEINSPLETVDLRGQVAAFKEWSEGYEELEAIPFSFVIEFKDQRTWSVFADSENDKFRILGLLKHTSGL